MQHWSWLFALAAMPACGCGSTAEPPDGGQPSSTTSASPGPTDSAAEGSTLALASPFVKEDLVDLGQRRVSRFAYVESTNTLFASFGDPPTLEGKPPPAEHENEIEEWDLSAGRRRFVYSLPPSWMPDDVYPSPDGSLLGVLLYGKTAPAWCRVSVFDTTSHARVHSSACAFLDRHTKILYDAGSHFAIESRNAIENTAPPSFRTFDHAGHSVAIDAKQFAAKPNCPGCEEIEQVQGRNDHGLYFTDASGTRSLVEKNPEHGGFGLTNDGKWLVVATSNGELVIWSTEARREVSREKSTESNGHLVYDSMRDRFLFAVAADSGSSLVRVLRRR